MAVLKTKGAKESFVFFSINTGLRDTQSAVLYQDAVDKAIARFRKQGYSILIADGTAPILPAPLDAAHAAPLPQVDFGLAGGIGGYYPAKAGSVKTEGKLFHKNPGMLYVGAPPYYRILLLLPLPL